MGLLKARWDLRELSDQWEKRVSKLLWPYLSFIWCCGSSWSWTSLPLGWRGRPSEKTLGSDQGGWAWLHRERRDQTRHFSFHILAFHLSFSSNGNLVVSQLRAVLGSVVSNPAVQNTALPCLGQQQPHPFSCWQILFPAGRALPPSHALDLQRLWTV